MSANNIENINSWQQSCKTFSLSSMNLEWPNNLSFFLIPKYRQLSWLMKKKAMSILPVGEEVNFGSLYLNHTSVKLKKSPIPPDIFNAWSMYWFMTSQHLLVHGHFSVAVTLFDMSWQHGASESLQHAS